MIILIIYNATPDFRMKWKSGVFLSNNPIPNFRKIGKVINVLHYGWFHSILTKGIDRVHTNMVYFKHSLVNVYKKRREGERNYEKSVQNRL